LSGISWHKSIIPRTAAIFFVVVAAATYVTMSVSGQNDLRAFAERRYRDVLLVMQAAIDPRFQTKAEELARVCERLVVIDAVKGGAMIDDSGHLQQAFGERPETEFQAIMRTGRQIFQPHETNRLEFYFPPEQTRTPFHIVARVNSDDLSSLEALSTNRQVFLSLMAGAIASAIATIVLLLLVTYPLSRIHKAIEGILADPSNADDGVKLRAGGSEVGTLARSVDFLRSRLADVWRTKVLVADGILETSPFATIEISPDGTPIFGNPACNALFGRDVVRSFGTSPLVVWDVEAEARNNLKFEIDAHPDETRLIEIATTAGSRYAMLASLVVGKETRAPLTIGMMAEVTAMHEARLALERTLAAADVDLRTASLREFELKLMLESCFSLLGGGRGHEVHIDIVPFGVEWMERAREVGLAVVGEVSEEGPQVAGGQEDLRSVIRLAAAAACARCGVTPVEARIDVRGINFETVGLEISVRPAQDGNGHRKSSLDANLIQAALRTACKRIGAQLGEIAQAEDSSQVRMTLRGAAERLTTTMKVGAKS
jgi:PAS domain-containing protein